MLNELYSLAGCLPKDIKLMYWHPKLKELPKITRQKPCYRVLIGEDGVSNIEIVRELPEGVRKWETANGHSFPAFNIKPVYVHKRAGKEVKKAFDDFLKKISKSASSESGAGDTLDGWLRESDPAWGKSDIERVAKCLNALPGDLQKSAGSTPAEFSAWDVLLGRAVRVNAQRFYEQLIKLVKEKIADGQSLADYAPLLFHMDQRKKLGNSVALLLDVAEDTGKFEYPVQHRKVMDWLNARLNETHTTKPTIKRSVAPDAFGKDPTGWKKKLPEVKLDILGPVKLRAMNHESPCQRRYGRIDADSYVVGDEVRKQTKAALEWLRTFQGKTWVNATQAADTKELLFAYPTQISGEPPATAGMFGGQTENAAGDAALFSEYAARVTEALKGIAKPLNEIEVRVFALRKMDKARTQVALTRHYTAARLVKAAEDWQSGCRNVPAIQIGYFPQGEKSPEWASPVTPFPLEVVWCLNTVWSHLGIQADRAVQFPAEVGVRLLLDEGVGLRQLAQRALMVGVRNLGDLLLATAQRQHEGIVHTAGGKFNKQARLAPALFGLLLDKLGHKKEAYMESAPFLVGRLLSLADQLHYQYCMHVRNQQVPPQLLGNALMSTALETPERALALFAQRVLPYQAWAKTYSDENAGLIHFFLKELGETASALAQTNLSERQASDADKAQMLLGYLARNQENG